MDCQAIKELLPNYADHVLPADEEKAVKAHLAGCADCQQELKALEQTWKLLGEWKDIAPDPAHVSQFWTRLADRSRPRNSVLVNIKNILFKGRLFPVLLAGCLTFLIGVTIVNNLPPVQAPDETLAALDADDLEMVDNIELAVDYDLIENMDLLEDLEVIEDMDALPSG